MRNISPLKHTIITNVLDRSNTRKKYWDGEIFWAFEGRVFKNDKYMLVWQQMRL